MLSSLAGYMRDDFSVKTSKNQVAFNFGAKEAVAQCDQNLPHCGLQCKGNSLYYVHALNL